MNKDEHKCSDRQHDNVDIPTYLFLFFSPNTEEEKGTLIQYYHLPYCNFFLIIRASFERTITIL